MESRNSIQDLWGPRTPFRGRDQWPERVDCRITAEPDRWFQSACVLCSNGCALDIAVKGGRIVGVRGRAVDAVNKGRLGPKGLNGWEANNSTRSAAASSPQNTRKITARDLERGDGPRRRA